MGGMRILPSASVWSATVVLLVAWIAAIGQLTHIRGLHGGRDPIAHCTAPHAPHAPWVVGVAVVVRVDCAPLADLQRQLDAIADSELRPSTIVLARGWRLCAELVEGLASVTASLRTRGVRVTTWVSPFITAGTPDFKELQSRRLLLTEGKLRRWISHDGTEVDGALIDLTHPEGSRWLHTRVIEEVTAAGVDGVLCDPADALLISEHHEHGHVGHIPQENYSKHYYWEVFDHGRRKRGYDFALMGAGVASFPHTAHATLLPPDVGFAVWADWGSGCPSTREGMAKTAAAVFRSGNEGYVGVGIGPCQASGPIGPTGLRALQFSALLPTMLIDLGRLKDAQAMCKGVSEAAKVNVAAHDELRPYLLSAAAAAWSREKDASTHSAVRPLGDLPVFGPVDTLHFTLGDDLVVCPAHDDGDVPCPLPEGGWLRADSRPRDVRRGNLSLPNAAAGLGWVFKREGAVIALRPRGQYSPFLWSQYGMPAPRASVLTLIIDSPRPSGEGFVAGTYVREALCVQYRRVSDTLQVTISPSREPVLLVIRPAPIKGRAEVVERFREVDLTPLWKPANDENKLFGVEDQWDIWAATGNTDTSPALFWQEPQGSDVWIYLPRAVAGSRLVIRGEQSQ
eukprot:Hpha_TRINITY_DN26418_c0_g1::TRINITY_DN26418_c0_g1_i1::g.33965::m.33965/K01811/xylS, yicI; alpha-D-xyloside xylohydrolase